MRYRLAAVAAAGAVAAIGLLPAQGRATADCTPRQVWAGSETTMQHNGNTLVRVPVSQPVSLRGLTVDAGYAQLSGAGYAEMLLLVGVSHGAPQFDRSLFPVALADPAFGPLNVTTTGNVGHNENPSLTPGVVDARIVKSTQGTGHVTAERTFNPALQLGPGDVLWVNYGSVSGSALDPEVQVVATVAAPGC